MVSFCFTKISDFHLLRSKALLCCQFSVNYETLSNFFAVLESTMVPTFLSLGCNFRFCFDCTVLAILFKLCNVAKFVVVLEIQ